MRIRLSGGLRWLYPGMRVKRWTLLSLLSTGLIVLALLEVLGKEQVGEIYRLLPISGPQRYLLIGLFLVLGIAGFLLGLFHLVRSVARGVAPGLVAKPSVAIGGGTGLSTLLRGLKEETANITAVVTVMDDGGSSGRLRSELDVLPPGDVRNCILALAEDEERMERLFQHRFRGGADLKGHSMGNLLLVGLEQATGGFDRAIEEMSLILNTRGQVLPATLEKTHLRAQMEDQAWVEGESHITADPRRIVRISLSSENVLPYARVIGEIERADLILLGPGSLFTSLIPNLLIDGIARAIAAARAEKVLVANLMTQPGETDRFTLNDHLLVLAEYVDLRSFDSILVNNVSPAEDLLSGYREEAAGRTSMLCRWSWPISWGRSRWMENQR